MVDSALSRLIPLLALVLVAGCSSGETGRSTGGASTPWTATPSASSGAATGPFRVGDCFDPLAGAQGWGGCHRPHDHEVMSAQRVPETAAGTSARTTMRRACYGALPAYLKSKEAHASRLRASVAGPLRAKGGAHWFACLVSEEGPDGHPVRRTGTLARALAGGLGTFQKCLVDEPLADGPVRIVPCDRPHRSEAVPGVLVLGAPTDRVPDRKELTSRAFKHCEQTVNTYLGGAKPGVRPSSVSPLPEEWRDGDTTAICYAVTKKPVTGSLRTP